MNAPRTRGASISARARTSSVDLARLAELTTAAIGPGAGSAAGPAALPFITTADGGRRLRMNLRGVLERLFAQPGFKAGFAPGADTGFLRDLDLPPRGTCAVMGGRLLPDSEAGMTAAIGKLHAAVSTELDKALANVDLHALVALTAEQVLGALAGHPGIRASETPSTAMLVPIGFADPERNAAERSRDVARVLTAIETVEGGEWLDKLLDGMRRWFERKGLPDQEIDGIIETLQLQRQQPGSPLRRLLDFLEDEALARLRLQVTMRLMEAVAGGSAQPGFARYVERVRACFELFGGAAGESLALDASTVYGQRNCGDLAAYLRTAGFYATLPVWPEWSVQLFEARMEPDHGFATRREVSYRFRVNGINQATGKAAFASRLDRIEARLLSAPGPEVNGRLAIAELVFLRLVTPDSMTQPTTEDLRAKASAIAAALKKNPIGAVTRLIAGLRQREPVMDGLAGELITVLRRKSTRLVDAANRTADKFFIAVRSGIIDDNAALSIASNSTDVLVRNEHGDDHIAWFEHIEITDDPASVPACLASFWVETNLTERSLAPAGDPTAVHMDRMHGQPILPVRFVACKCVRHATGDAAWVAEDDAVSLFDAGHGIDLEYSVRSLTAKRNTDDKAAQEQLRTAACAAFALVCYLALWELVRRLKATDGIGDPAMFILRLQPGSREVSPADGNAAVYAIAHAIERSLMRELPVKMQGFHTGGEVETGRYRKAGALAALRSGTPLETDLAGSLDGVALISYVTRPSHMHPLQPDADGYLFVSRTYRADRVAGAGRRAVLRADRMQSRLADTGRQFHEPKLVLEEIARLHAAGYRHVVLLSHHFGNRHIGRAAERHAPHGTFDFLDEAARLFPDVHLYPLRRDVFPATRLHKRQATESGFEVLSFADNQAMYDIQARSLLRSQMPVYTFATLAVVSENGRPQSGFCTYFFDSEQRLGSVVWGETVRQNILGTGAGKPVRESIVGMLRALHYLESEKPAGKGQVLPVLDPFDWSCPASTGAAGELEVVKRRTSGAVRLSFAALLAHVTKVLHKDGA